MNRNNSERPSIIQEIVFYDKPNIKPVVPAEILSDSSVVPVGKGDIVISRVRKSSLPPINIKKQRVKINLPKTSNQESTPLAEKHPVKTLNEDEHKDSKHLSTIESLNHFINYESFGEDLLETENVVQDSNESSLAGPNKSSESVDELPQVPKKAYKSVKQSKISDGLNEGLSTENLKLKKGKGTFIAEKTSAKVTKEATQESPFKKPNRPIQNAKRKYQKVTMLNYITKKPKDAKEQCPPNQKKAVSKEVSGETTKEKSPVKETTVKVGKGAKEKPAKRSERLNKSQRKSDKDEEESSKKGLKKKTTSSLKKKGVEPKKSRGRPRKTFKSVNQVVKTEGYYSDEDVSFKSTDKNKSYTELTNVPLANNRESVETTDDLEDLLDDAQQHVKTLDRVEKDLESMFRNGDEEERLQTSKGKRKAPGRKPKTPLMLVKRVKREVEETEDEDSSREILDTSVVDEYEEDSRGEWVPVEYAEYKQQHIMRNQNKLYPCKYCGDQFPSYYSMRKHRALQHDDLGKDRKEGTYKDSLKCKQEKADDDSDEESRDEWMPQDYAEYKVKHKMNKLKRVQWYKCKICCAVFSNYYKLSKHRVEHENKPNPYECKQCDDRFKDVESLMAHIRVHQGKDPYQCRKCEKGFMTKKELDEHVPVHILKKGPTPPKRFRCDICSKEFSKLCDIERHTRVHTGEKPSECNICHKRFQQSHNLSKHLLTHLHVKPFQCEICNKKFGRIDVLNRHLLTHSMDKPFKCEICSKGFIRHVQLTNHIEKFHTSSDRGLVVAQEEANNLEESIEDDPGEASIENEDEEACEEVIGI